jgi:hypothetical protein
MRSIKTILPLLTSVIHGQMRPPFALSSKDKRGMFPRLKVRMEQLLLNPNLESIDKWYMESLPQFTNLHIENEDNSTTAEDLIKRLEDSESSFIPTKVPEHFPIMAIEINVPNAFAEMFYDVALRLETIRTMYWLKNEEERLRNDESMLQVIRNILTRLNEYTHECIIRQKNFADNCNEIIQLRIMQLYFAIEYTFCKRNEWRNYLEEVCNLPLNLDEYCYQLWEGSPEIGWRKAYDDLSNANEVLETPNLPQLEDAPKLTTAAEKFAKEVSPFRFVELPLVKALNSKQQAELIELMVKDACYAAAMLMYLGYYDRLRNVYQKNNNEDIIKHCAKSLGSSNSTYKKYFYSLTCENPYETYERHNSKAFIDNEQIENDYKRIKESK